MDTGIRSDLDKTQLLSITAKTVPVDTEEWGTVYVRAMPAWARVKWSEHLTGDDHSTTAALFVVFTACDEKGCLLFTEEDVPQLQQLPYTLLDAVGKAALELNGMGRERIEELKKSSSTTQPSDSSSS